MEAKHSLVKGCNEFCRPVVVGGNEQFLLGDRLHQFRDVGVVAPGVAELSGDRLEGDFVGFFEGDGDCAAFTGHDSLYGHFECAKSFQS